MVCVGIIGGSGLLEINTTNTPWVIAVGNTVPARSAGVGLAASFNFIGLASGNGSAVIVFGNNSFQLVIDGQLTLANVLTFDVFAYVAIFPNVIIGGVSLDIDDLLGLLDLNLAGRLQINTTASDATSYTGADFDAAGNIVGFSAKNFVDVDGNPITIEARSFLLDVRGSLDLLGIVTLSGRVTVEVSPQGWLFAADSLSLQIFSLFNATASFSFNSDGEFHIDLGASVTLGPSGFNISGSAELDIATGTATASAAEIKQGVNINGVTRSARCSTSRCPPSYWACRTTRCPATSLFARDPCRCRASRGRPWIWVCSGRFAFRTRRSRSSI
jgi:hypothetical protein